MSDDPTTGAGPADAGSIEPGAIEPGAIEGGATDAGATDAGVPTTRVTATAVTRAGMGRVFTTGTRFLVATSITLLVVVAGLVAAGLFFSSAGGQPAQLTSTPRPTQDVIAMGDAHIPTTNACVLCHGAGGEIKLVPAMLHPVEGWRRCVTCHTDEKLGRVAPGHDGIAEEECLNCHREAETGPAITRPHSALMVQGCLTCHGSFAHLPSTMASAKEEDCILCHKPAALPPPEYPHAADIRLSCSECHRSPEVGNLPIDHAQRTDDQCLLCHEIWRVPGSSAAPAPSRPTPSLATGP